MYPNLLFFHPQLATGTVMYRVRGLPWAEKWAASTGSSRRNHDCSLLPLLRRGRREIPCNIRRGRRAIPCNIRRGSREIPYNVRREGELPLVISEIQKQSFVHAGRVGARYPWQTEASGKVASHANEAEIHIVGDVARSANDPCNVKGGRRAIPCNIRREGPLSLLISQGIVLSPFLYHKGLSSLHSRRPLAGPLDVAVLLRHPQHDVASSTRPPRPRGDRRHAQPLRNTKGYSSTYLAMGFANVRAGTWSQSSSRRGRARTPTGHSRSTRLKGRTSSTRGTTPATSMRPRP